MNKTSLFFLTCILMSVGCSQPNSNTPISTLDVTTNQTNETEQQQQQSENNKSTNNQTNSPSAENSSSYPESQTAPQENNYTSDLVYNGSASDPQSGITQNYTLKIKSDFSAASIGVGPFTIIEDQGDGSYMWLDGTIIGMSFRPSKNSCAVFGSDGSYFCRLYRQ